MESNVLVTGATGFIGSHLIPRLEERGQRVIALTRNQQRAQTRLGSRVGIITDAAQLDHATRIDAVINLAGARILSVPWTRSRRAQLLRSRVDFTRALVAALGNLPQRPRVLVSASAVGYYGVRGDELLSERDTGSAVFQSQLCQEWEAAARLAEASGIRVVTVRIGIVLARDGGALPQLAMPVRCGFGALLGTGEQWISWVHIVDLIRLFELALDDEALTGPLNAVSPIPVRQRQFQDALARALHRPLWLRVPAPLLRGLLGEMAQLLVDGQRVVPSKALARGFEFRYELIGDAVSSLLSRDS